MMIERLGFELFILCAACLGGLFAVIVSLIGAVRSKWREQRIVYLESRVATLRQQNVRLRNQLVDTLKTMRVRGVG